MKTICDEASDTTEIKRFKSKSTFAERKTNAKKYCENYPDYVPIILISKDGVFKNNECFKVFVNRNENACQIIYYIKKKLNMKDSEGALFLTINGNITPKLSTSLDCLYSLYKDDDDFLYVMFSKQNFMG